MTLSLPQLKLLSADIFQFFNGVDEPPADEIYVPVDLIHAVKNSPNTFTATVRFIVNYAGRKVHSIRIKFNIDARGQFLVDSWKYI